MTCTQYMSNLSYYYKKITHNKIHTTISSQSMFAIQDWMYFQNFNKNLKTAKLNGRGERGFDALPDIFNALYGGIINYSLIHPKNLILSLSSGSIKNNDYFNIETSNSYLKEIKKIYKETDNSNNFAFNYFIGTHEADPNGVIKIFEEQFLD